MGLLEQQLSNGLLNQDPLRAQTSNRNMLAQALKARQTTPRNALTGQGLLDTAAIGLSPIPVIGDLLGLGADANRFINEPESRTPLNFGLAALGLLPFVPSGVGAVKKMTQYEKAHEVAQKNAALPVAQGGLGLPPNNTAMDRAKAMGFEDTYHGSKSPDGIKNLIPGGADGSIRHGDAYGVGVYTSTDAIGDANSFGAQGAVFPLKIDRSNHLNVDSPKDADLKKLSKFAGENMLPSDKARFSIGREVRQFNNVQDAREFFKNQKENWNQFGDGMDRARPEAIANKDGTFAVGFTNFDADVPITSGADANTLLKSVGWDNVPSMGYSGHTLNRGGDRLWDVTTDTSKLRSRFAAFDPMRRNSSDLLANVAPFGLAGLLGLGLYDTKEGFRD